MARPKTAGPTEREMEILQVLWGLGPSTAREIFEVLNRQSRTAYTSVLTILSIMLEKGYVTRDESSKSHVYRATCSKGQVEEKLIRTLMDGVFGGSAMRLVTRALSLKETSQEERREVRQLLREMDGGQDDAN